MFCHKELITNVIKETFKISAQELMSSFFIQEISKERPDDFEKRVGLAVKVSLFFLFYVPMERF